MNENTLSTRFGEFELLKAIAILILPALHLLEKAISAGFASQGLLNIEETIITLCALGPSVFLICMGFSMSKGSSRPERFLKNGVQFLLIGAILNFLRWFLPGAVSAFMVQTDFFEDILFCLQSDIYFFIGLFHIFYSIMLRYKVTTPVILATSIGMLTVNTMTTPSLHTYLQPGVVSSVIGNFFYVDDTSSFPLLSWAIFPTVGILLGEVLKKANEGERQDLMKKLMIISSVVFFAMIVFLKSYRIVVKKVLISPLNESITDFPNAVLLICIATFLIGTTYYLYKYIATSRFTAFMLRVSSFSIPFNMLHWTFITWFFYGLVIVGATPKSIGIAAYLGGVVIITAICAYVATHHGKRIMKPLLRATSV